MTDILPTAHDCKNWTKVKIDGEYLIYNGTDECKDELHKKDLYISEFLGTKYL